MPRKKQDTPDVSKQLSDLIGSYFTFVVSELSGSQDDKEMVEYIKAHKIKSKLVTIKDQHFLNIYKGRKLIDQNSLSVFTKRLPKSPKEIILNATK